MIQIQGAEFKFDKDYYPQLIITITGEKKIGSSDSRYDMISYKLYDRDQQQPCLGRLSSDDGGVYYEAV